MAVFATLSIYNNIVYFGVDKFCCDEIHLVSAGIKFSQVCQIQERSRFNITIPPIDVQRAYFDSATGDQLSTLIIETVPNSGTTIRDTLRIEPNQVDNSGSLRVVVQLNGNGEEIFQTIEDYFFAFGSRTWRFERTLTISVHQYFDFLNNYSQQLTTTTPSSTLGPSSMPAQSFKTNVLRPKSDESSSMIDGDRNRNQRNSNDSASNSDAVLFSYPPNETECISIRQSDLSCLEEGQQINDQILSFYLKYIERDLTSPNIAERSYIFSPSFYFKLTHKLRASNAEDHQSLSEKYHNRVKNWTKDINIFAKDFIIIPINKSCHWFLAIICYPRKVPFMGQDLPIEIEKHPKRPRILFLDSLQSAHDKCGLAAPLRHFLTKEWQVKISSKKNFGKSAIPDIYLKVPKQHNAFDGGLYVITCIENFLRNPDYLLNKICLDPAIDLGDWFSSTLASSKRRTIKRLIKQQREAAEKKENGVK